MTYERNYNLLNNKFKELFIPTLLASIAGNFAVLADALLISMFMGPLNLFVIQSVGPLVAFVNVIYWLIGFGGSILCTHARAEFDSEKGNYLFTVSLISVILIGLAISLLGFLFPDFFMQLLSASNQFKPLISQYFNLYIIGIPFLSYFAVLAYFIKTDDFIKLQFRTFLLCNAINVILDVVFIKFLNFGIAGAGLATTLGNIIAAIYITTYFFNSKATLKLVKVRFFKSMRYLVDISKAGFSSASIPLYESVKLLFINILIGGILGEVGLAAFNMCFNILYFVWIFILGTAQSILPIVAVYYAEEDFQGIDYVTKISLKIALLFGIFFTILFVVFPQSILSIFSVTDPLQIPIILNAVRIFSLCFLGYSISLLYIFYAPSVEYYKLANIIAILEGLILPIIFAYLFGYFWSVDGIWISFSITEVGTVLFIYIYSKYVSKKTNGMYSGFFINKQLRDKRRKEYTVKGNKEDVLILSKEINSYFDDSNLSLVIEQMLFYIIDINDGLDWIDIIVREKDDSFLISIKDNGINFNPENINSSADDIDYSQILGLNITLLTVKNN